MLASKLLSAAGGTETLYVDDVFSTYLYTGNGSTQTINNGIDLAGKGGLVWLKERAGTTNGHYLFDTARGANYGLIANETGAQGLWANYLNSFNSSGFTVGANASQVSINSVSWTFRKAARFFDCGTFVGSGTSGQQITHALGLLPGMVIFKRTDSASAWNVLARKANGTYDYLALNTTAAAFSNDTAANAGLTTTYFSPGIGFGTVNGASYVWYALAHDPSADGIIQCGSFTTDGSGNATVNLGWEPQFAILKGSSAAGYPWIVRDSMRGWATDSNSPNLYANTSGAEDAGNNWFRPNATGFSVVGAWSSTTIVYLAIRRPNKPPTTGTQVYNAIARTGTGAAATVTGVGFAPDLALIADRTQASGNSEKTVMSRLQGPRAQLVANTTAAEAAFGADAYVMQNDGVHLPSGYGAVNGSGGAYINHFFKRAVGVFDQVCYTGTGSALTVNHSLGVVPELIVVKQRSSSSGTRNWISYHKDAGGSNKYLYLNTTDGALTASGVWPGVSASTVSLSASYAEYNESAKDYVMYLWATKAGISKVGSYTGNGSSQTIDCGFTTGARFFLVKATSTTGSWWVYDSTRGVISAADPALQLNSTAAEVTSADAVDPASSGIIVNQEATCPINANGVSYIYLALS